MITDSTQFSGSATSYQIDKLWYEDDLKERQKRHLESVQRHLNTKLWKPCLHDSCPSCIGTGIKIDGSICVHNLYCNCPKCSPTCY